LRIELDQRNAQVLERVHRGLALGLGQRAFALARVGCGSVIRIAAAPRGAYG